jgi:hypothetical protein
MICAPLTKGLARASRDCYQEHGVPKQLYLRELRPGARKLLRKARWPGAPALHGIQCLSASVLNLVGAPGHFFAFNLSGELK